MSLGVNIFDFYITICDKTPEVMILDSNVLLTKSYFWRNRDCNKPLIVFVNCDLVFEKTEQYCRCISLNFEYKLNFLRNTHSK